MYWDDRYGTETVSHEVLGRMKQLMVDNNTAASHSFLLDDDSSIPFSLDDISNLMEDKVSQGTHKLCTEAYLRLLLACLLSEAVYALLFRRLWCAAVARFACVGLSCKCHDTYNMSKRHHV